MTPVPADPTPPDRVAGASADGGAGRSEQSALAVFRREVEALCRGERLFDAARPALVMVSGGQDSLALLHVLAEGRLGAAGPAGVWALHVNYHLRGGESDADEALVRERCAALCVGLTVVDEPLDKHTGNLQARAREARRAAALAVAAERGLPRIAVAHTLDDQVETMLYRIGRYAGLAALRAMRPVSLPWVRPLLGVRRTETAAYCRAAGMRWAIDRGNDDPGYARTGLRGRVLPTWEAELPGAARSAARVAVVVAETAALVDEWVDWAGRWDGPAMTPGGSRGGGPRRAPAGDASAGGETPGGGRGGVAVAEEWSAVHLLALPPAVRRAFLHARLSALGDVEVSRSLVLGVEEVLAKGGTAAVDLGGGWRAVRAYDRVRFERGLGREAVEASGPVRLPFPGSVRWGAVTVDAAAATRFRAPDPTAEAYLDADAVGRAADGRDLVVRGPLPSDRFHPLGAPGSRRLQDVLVDWRVPAERRRNLPLVVAGDRVVWVGGFAVAEEGRISSTTRRLVHLRLSREETSTPA